MTPEFIEKVKRDYYAQDVRPDWTSYLAGYIACLKRFGGNNCEHRTTSKTIQRQRTHCASNL